jgi:hypothetical protein
MQNKALLAISRAVWEAPMCRFSLHMSAGGAEKHQSRFCECLFFLDLFKSGTALAVLTVRTKKVSVTQGIFVI